MYTPTTENTLKRDFNVGDKVRLTKLGKNLEQTFDCIVTCFPMHNPNDKDYRMELKSEQFIGRTTISLIHDYYGCLHITQVKLEKLSD